LESQLRAAVAKNPNQVEAILRLGQFDVAHSQPTQAIPLLKRALELDPKNYIASRELATAWLENGDFDQARRVLTPLADEQAKAEVHQLLARADEGLGQFQQAAREYRLADTKDPSEESIFGAGYELILAGSVADGVGELQAGVARYPHSIALWIGLGSAQFFQGKTTEALHSFLDASEIDPADPRPYSFLASVSGTTDDQSERVRESFKRYLERKPESAAANYYYALALSRQGTAADTNQSEKLLKRAIQLDSNIAKAHLQLADLYAQREDDANAVPEYEAAVRLAQENGEAHYRLAMAYKRIGKANEAAREMQIFRLSKQQAAKSEGIDLTQFVSVMNASDHDSEQEAKCSVAAR
jgi:tetratricopeptide (TPR) repeat protein